MLSMFKYSQNLQDQATVLSSSPHQIHTVSPIKSSKETATQFMWNA